MSYKPDTKRWEVGPTDPDLPSVKLGSAVLESLRIPQPDRADRHAVVAMVGHWAANAAFLHFAHLGKDISKAVISYLNGDPRAEEVRTLAIARAKTLLLGAPYIDNAIDLQALLGNHVKELLEEDNPNRPKGKGAKWAVEQVNAIVVAALRIEAWPARPKKARAAKSTPAKATKATKTTATKKTTKKAPAKKVAQKAAKAIAPPIAPGARAEAPRAQPDFEPLPAEFASLSLDQAARGLVELADLADSVRNAVVAHLTTSIASGVDIRQIKASLDKMSVLFRDYYDSLRPQQKRSSGFEAGWGVVKRLLGFDVNPVTITAVALALTNGKEEPVKQALAAIARRTLHCKLSQDDALKQRVFTYINSH